MLRFSLSVLLILFTCMGNSQDIRGLYVNKIDKILGDPVAENELCIYVRECRFNHLLFYSLSRVDFTNLNQCNQLRSLLKRLRTDYGVNRIGAVGENFEFFLNSIHTYNMDPETDPLEQFDVYDLEFEFWNNSVVTGYYCDQYLRPAGFPCTDEGAFSYVKKTLVALRAMKVDIPQLETEIYIGWINPQKAVQLPALVDRILPAVYMSARADGSINLYNPENQRQRIRELAAGGPFKLLPIFNGDKDSYDPDLYPWLTSGHTVCEPWFNYLDGFEKETDPVIRQNVRLEGYQWFKYSGMPPVPILLNSPGPVEGPRYPEISFPHIFSIPEVSGADEIHWTLASTGETTVYNASENTHPLTFTHVGADTLMIQAFRCGAKSKVYTFPVDVRDIGMGNGKELTDDGRRMTDVWSGINGICVRIPRPLIHQGVLTVMDAMGRCLYRKEIPAGYAGEEVFPAENGLFLVTLTSGKERFTTKIVR